MDLIIRRAALGPDRDPVDIGIEGGRFAAIEPQLAATAPEEIDAAGSLVTAPFVDAHFHMDATLSLRQHARERVGNAAGGDRVMG